MLDMASHERCSSTVFESEIDFLALKKLMDMHPQGV